MGQTTEIGLFPTVYDHLTEKGYIEVKPFAPFELAMLKQTFGGTIPKVIVIADVTHNTDSPTTIYNHHANWFKTLLGNTGSGVILFVYRQPPAFIVDEVLKLGKGILGYGQVIAGVYDAFSNKYWLSDHMGWKSEIFS